MPPTVLRDARVLFNDASIGGSMNEVEVDSSAAYLDGSTFGTPAVKFYGGLRNVDVSARGFWRAGDVDVSVFQQVGTGYGSNEFNLLTICPDDDAFGDTALLVTADALNYGFGGRVREIIPFTLRAHGDQIDDGSVLHALSRETNAGSSSAIDNGAATAGGLVAHVHATSTPTVNWTVRIDHSDSGLFPPFGGAVLVQTTITAAARAARLVVAAGTTVNRFIRGWWSPASTPANLTFFLGFARR